MLPTDSAARKALPLLTFLKGYFPRTFVALTRHSVAANEKHNPGEPLHWSRDKSNDHGNCIIRHQLECDGHSTDPDTGELIEVAVAWRACAQSELALDALALRKSLHDEVAKMPSVKQLLRRFDEEQDKQMRDAKTLKQNIDEGRPRYQGLVSDPHELTAVKGTLGDTLLYNGSAVRTLDEAPAAVLELPPENLAKLPTSDRHLTQAEIETFNDLFQERINHTRNHT